jgi:hypothetical protein
MRRAVYARAGAGDGSILLELQELFVALHRGSGAANGNSNNTAAVKKIESFVAPPPVSTERLTRDGFGWRSTEHYQQVSENKCLSL